MASVLKVDKLDPQSGTALEIGTSGDTISLPSGATLDISASTLTPPATMPASSGANLTALDAGNISAGTLAAARGGTGTTAFDPAKIVQFVFKANSTEYIVPDNTNWNDYDSGTSGSEYLTITPKSSSNFHLALWSPQCWVTQTTDEFFYYGLQMSQDQSGVRQNNNGGGVYMFGNRFAEINDDLASYEKRITGDYFSLDNTNETKYYGQIRKVTNDPDFNISINGSYTNYGGWMIVLEIAP